MAAAAVITIIILLILISVYPRQVLVISIVGGVFIVGYISDMKEEADRLRQKENNIIIRVTIDKNKCHDSNFPLLITTQNQSGDTVVYVNFGVRAYRPNHSRPILSSSYKSDRIIPNGETWERCRSAPSGDTMGIPLERLVWITAYKNVQWQ